MFMFMIVGSEINIENNPAVSNKVRNIQSRKRKCGTQIEIQEQTKTKIPESTVTSEVIMAANEDEYDANVGKEIGNSRVAIK